MNKTEIMATLKDNPEYKAARLAWGFFLRAYGDECDMDAAIDDIAEGVLEMALEKKK